MGAIRACPRLTQARSAHGTRLRHTPRSHPDVRPFISALLSALTATPFPHCRFGGTDGSYHYNDTWMFDVPTRRWEELSCIGYIPSPREGHAAALVDDVMYVFGGRGVDGKDLGDLTAFKISSESIPYLVCRVRSNNFSRQAVVHVPKYGPQSRWTIRSCYGILWFARFRPWWRGV